MFLVKITAVLIVIYFLNKAIIKNYVNSLTGFDVVRFSIHDFTKIETVMMLILGVLRILMYIFICVTFLCFVFTHF